MIGMTRTSGDSKGHSLQMESKVLRASVSNGITTDPTSAIASFWLLVSEENKIQFS